MGVHHVRSVSLYFSTAAGVGSPSPVILWNGTTALLAVEQEVMTDCPEDEIPTALLAS